MVSIIDKYNKKGVSPVIGVILLVALVVALIALVSVIVFNIGTDSSTDSADTAIDFSQTSSGVSVQVVSNNNVDEFIISGPDDFEETLSGSVGSSTNLIGPEGQYTVIAVLEEGEEQVLLTENVEGLDYSGVFVVTQDEDEEEVEAELRQQFDNVDEYSLELVTSEGDSTDSELIDATHTYSEGLLSEELINNEGESVSEERLALLNILTNEAIENFEGGEENLFSVGERIAVHEMVNLCPGDELVLTELDSEDSELTSEEITVDTGCDELRQIAKYIDGEITAIELINTFGQNRNYFVSDITALNPELPETTVPIDEEDGTTVIVNVSDTDDNRLENANVHVADQTNVTNEEGQAIFENIARNETIDAVAYKQGYQPSEVTEIDVINPDDNPQYENLTLELEELDEIEEPSTEDGSIESGGSETVGVSGGGGAVVGSFGGGGGSAIGGGGAGGGYIGGGGSFYGAGGASTGATTTTLSGTSPSTSPETVEVMEPQRVFNVQPIDDSLIPTDREFTVETTATNNGQGSVEDEISVYKSSSDSESLTELNSEEVILPENPDTVVNSQDLDIGTEGNYSIYVSLESSGEYQYAGSLNVFPEDRLNASLNIDSVNYELTDGDGEDVDRANVGDSIEITVSADDIDGASSGTIDIFKNGNRVTSEEINSAVTYEEEFDSAEYAQFHIGMQESESVALLDTIVVTETVKSLNVNEFTADAEKADDDNCLSDDIGTSGQFDCQVDLDDNSTVGFSASESEFELNTSADGIDEAEFDDIDYEWRFGDEGTQSVNSTDKTVTHEFENDTVHLVEFIVDAEEDGETFTDRDSFVVNAVTNPDEIGTSIQSTNVDENNNVTVNIENDRQTIDEEVTVEFVNITGEVDTVHEETITVRSDSQIEYRKTVDDVSDYTDATLEGGATVPFEVRLTDEGETTQFRDESEFEETLTVPEASINAVIEATIEIIEE